MISKVYNAVMRRTGLQYVISGKRTRRKVKQGEKVKVVFICQVPYIWGCMESVYEAAIKDERFEATILAIPNNWDTEEISFEAYDFCTEKGYQVINAYDSSNNSFFDLEKFEPDYVFFPRPYDYYLPLHYRSGSVSKYSKTCYIGYGYVAEGGEVLETCYDRAFTSNCYFVFAENDSTREYSVSNHKLSVILGLRRIVKTPFPRFDLLFKWNNCEPEHWIIKKENVNKRIIWTPRWTTDEALGGTNFFAYKDFFLDYAKRHVDCEFLFRPHPLAFKHFIECGKMTQEQVDEYKRICQEMENIQLDERKEYLDSFASADILVSDMSGVVEDFLVTGKPLVFCSYNQEFNKASERLLEAFYIPHNVEELTQILEKLIRDEDPKKELRKKLVEEILGSTDGMNGERILDYIREDVGIK